MMKQFTQTFQLYHRISMDEISLVTLHQTEQKEQATLLKAVLEQEGVSVVLEGMGGSALGEAFDGADLVSVLVPEAHVDKCRRILDEIMAANEEVIPAWSCECGEEVDEGFFVCWSCQAEYKADPSETTTDRTED